MNKLYRRLALLTVPLFMLQILSVVTNIDPRTGFFRSGGWFLLIAQILVLTAAIVWIYSKAQKTTLNTAGPQDNPYAALFFGATGITSAIGSVMQLVGALRTAPFSALFMSKKKLLENYASTHFRIEFVCALVGMIAAVWFLWAAVRLIKTGSVSGSPYFCCVPVLWYIIRALSDFSISTVNYHNTVILISLAADLMLALLFLRLIWVASLGYPKENISGLAPFALLAFVFTISFKTPLTLIALQTSGTDFLLILTDTFAATGAFIAVDQLLKEKAA